MITEIGAPRGWRKVTVVSQFEFLTYLVTNQEIQTDPLLRSHTISDRGYFVNYLREQMRVGRWDGHGRASGRQAMPCPYGFISFPLICRSKPFGSFT